MLHTPHTVHHIITFRTKNITSKPNATCAQIWKKEHLKKNWNQSTEGQFSCEVHIFLADSPHFLGAFRNWGSLPIQLHLLPICATNRFQFLPPRDKANRKREWRANMTRSHLQSFCKSIEKGNQSGCTRRTTEMLHGMLNTHRTTQIRSGALYYSSEA